MKKILITGGLGYIGTELCKIYSGYSWNDKITVIDNRFVSERVNQIRNWNMEFIQGDILDKNLINKVKLSVALKYIPPVFCEISFNKTSSISTLVSPYLNFPFGRIPTGANAVPLLPRPIV